MTLKYPEKAVYEIIKDLAVVAAENQVYVGRAPQGVTGDFIVMNNTDSARMRELTAATGMAQATVQIDCYSESPFGAKDLAAAVEGALDSYVGVVSYGDESPQESIRLAGANLQNMFDVVEPQERTPFLYRTTSIYLVTYEQ